MYTIIILFFASLAGIIVMIGRKLVFVRNAQIMGRDDVLHPFSPDLQKIKHLTRRSAKVYSYAALVATIRLYIRSANIVKDTLKETKTKIKNFRKTDTNGTEDQGPNKFLKKMTEYKHKIREIKHKIKEEEKS